MGHIFVCNALSFSCKKFHWPLFSLLFFFFFFDFDIRETKWGIFLDQRAYPCIIAFLFTALLFLAKEVERNDSA